MGNTITSKNSWELLLSSIAGAWDGADTFVLGTFDEAENYKYKTKITNLRTKQEISPFITQIKLSIPDSSDKISSVKASFSLEEKVVQTGDEITIEVLNSSESAKLTILSGIAKVTNRNMHMLNTNIYNIEILDEFDKLFEKVVSENVFLFDKYIYSEQYKENSILYIIAKKLGFLDEQMNFEDVRDSQSRLVKIPFMLLRKNNRYIDELQTILDVSKGRMYIDNLKQIIFVNGLFEYEKAIAYAFDNRNILKSVDENYKYTDKNGVRVVYDTYKYLANQVIFDLANKVEVAPGTTSATAKEFGIKFITDLATQHNITKAEGYYYENEQQIRISLLLNTHYEVIEFSETSAKVKFLNPYASKFYIDKFEIKGIPLAMFSDNEVSVKATKDMLENEENFSSYNKNKYIQTEELASDIARVEYIRNCKNKKEYSFKSNFVPHLEPGDICTLKINDIDTLIQLSTIEHTLSRVNGFYSEIVALEYEKIEQEFNYSKLESLTAKDSFLGTLNNIKDQVDETDKKLEEVILIEGARGFTSETDPSLEREIKEPDVWFHPITKEFKVWRNGKWNPSREEDIPPALMTALKAQAGYFSIGGNDVMAGIFFQYDKDKKNPVFGATDSESLAQVSIDKDANVLIRNANNKLALNMRNPENPSEIISQILMGVYNADDIKHKDTLFQVGDESTGTYIKFGRNVKTIAYDGKDVKEHVEGAQNTANNAINNQNDGIFTVNANTIFAGDATFVSKGSNETTIIRDGSITFTRNNVPITVIRNMKIGSIKTDGYGIGRVTFTGFKNLDVLTSIKSFNISTNIRSLNAHASLVDAVANTWAFYVYGTEAVMSGGIDGAFTYNGNSGSFTLKFIRLVANTLSQIVHNTNPIFDYDSLKSSDSAVWNIVGIASIEIKVSCENKYGKTTIGYFNSTVNVTPQGYNEGSRRRIRIPSQTLYIPITISHIIPTLESSVITIEILSMHVRVTGSLTCNSIWSDGPWTVKVDTGNAALYTGNGSSLTYTYYNENIVSIGGEGEVQYIAVEK